MGAILFANKLSDFPNMTGREVIVRKYVGTNNRQQIFEQHGVYGYANGFEGLVDFIMKQTYKEEQIDIRYTHISSRCYKRIHGKCVSPSGFWYYRNACHRGDILESSDNNKSRSTTE